MPTFFHSEEPRSNYISRGSSDDPSQAQRLSFHLWALLTRYHRTGPIRWQAAATEIVEAIGSYNRD